MIDRTQLQYHFDLEQGTEEWLQMRLGRLTGTDANVLFTNGKDADGLGAGAKTVIYKNASEIITGDGGESFGGNAHTERGNSFEPLAVEMYEESTYNAVTKCGFISLGHYIGYSPDGLVGEDGLIEVKSPDNKEYLRVYLEREIDSKYMAQMYFGMWVTGRKWCDNIYFNPLFSACPMFFIRVERDEKVMQMLDAKMAAVIGRMDEILYKFK